VVDMRILHMGVISVLDRSKVNSAIEIQASRQQNFLLLALCK
jgi:hypothetical protein